ncbi:hypothetical protein D3C77_771470 [compost metagenome]
MTIICGCIPFLTNACMLDPAAIISICGDKRFIHSISSFREGPDEMTRAVLPSNL